MTWELDDHDEAEHLLLAELDEIELKHLLDKSGLHCCPDKKGRPATELLEEAAAPVAQGLPVSAGEVEAAEEPDPAASRKGNLLHLLLCLLNFQNLPWRLRNRRN